MNGKKYDFQLQLIPNKESEDVLFAVYLIYGIQLLHGKLHRKARGHGRVGVSAATCGLVATVLGVHDGIGVDVEEKETLVFLSTVPCLRIIQCQHRRIEVVINTNERTHVKTSAFP